MCSWLMQLFSDEWAYVEGDKIIPMYSTMPACSKCYMYLMCLCGTFFSNYSCHFFPPNKYATYIYDN